MYGYDYPSAIIITDHTQAFTGRFGKVVALKNSTVDLVAENITENTSSTISGIPLHSFSRDMWCDYKCSSCKR